MTMKTRFKIFWTVMALVAVFTVTISAQESLGDIARRVRMEKAAPPPGAKVYDNDTIPMHPIPSPAAAPSSEGTKGAAAAPEKAAQAGAEEKKAQADVNSDWQKKIDDQKNQISLMERELNVLQRENQIATAVYYADAGTQLRDPKKFGEDVRAQKAAIDAKQQQLNDARQKLADMQEEARKANVPASARD